MSHIVAEYQAMQRWIRDEMPVLITFTVATDCDDWLSASIRGQPMPEPQAALQWVVVQGMWEADRVRAALATVKYTKRLPYGGSTTERYRPA